MKLLYKTAKNKYRIYSDCFYDGEYDNYCKSLKDPNIGYKILDRFKIVGEILDNGKLEPFLHYKCPPIEVLRICRENKIEIEMDCEIHGGAGCKLYYWKGRYRKAKELFEI